MSTTVTSVIGSLPPGSSKVNVHEVELGSSAAQEGQKGSMVRQATGAESNKRPDRAQFDQTAAELTNYASVLGTRVRFSINDRYGEVVMEIIDAQSQDLIRQIPAEDILEFAEFFRDLEANKVKIQAGRGIGHASIEGLLIHLQA